jgi:hypothetical protein
MTHLLCRNTVRDFDRWLRVFSSHKKAHVDAGLILEHLWQASDDPARIFFLFRVEDMEKAKAFISAPDASDAARTSGVIDGEYHFVDSADGY